MLPVLLMACATIAFAAGHSTPPENIPTGVKLTGRFVGWIEGARLTSFGLNYDSLIFAVQTGPRPHIVKISYPFLLYEPQITKPRLDYTTVYTFHAVPDNTCKGTLEDMSRRYVLNAAGAFEASERSLGYTQHVPPLDLPWHETLQCYVIGPEVAAEIEASFDSY